MRKSRPRPRRRHGGFTLIEVLLVLAILVILGSLAVGTYMGTFAKAKIDSARTGISPIKTQVEVFFMHVGEYPPSLDALVQPPPNIPNPASWAGPYLEKVPLDPWGHVYLYEVGPGGFRVWSAGPDGIPGTADDVMEQ